MSLKVERYIPSVVALAVMGLWWLCDAHLPNGEKEFLAAALSVGAIFTGFIATAQAILMALPTDSVMGRLRSSNYISDLIDYIGSALRGGILFCISCLAGFYLVESSTATKFWFGMWWCFWGVYTLLTFHRVTNIIMKIMRIP